MLRHVLDPARWDLELIAPATLTAELLDLVAERRPGAVCIATDPARRPGAYPLPVQAAAVAVPRPEDPRGPLGGAGHHDDRAGPRRRRRSLGRRAKEATADAAAAAPARPWSHPMVAGLEEAGADFVATTLLETRQQLASLIPVLAQGPDGRDRDGRRGRSPGNGRGPAAPRTARWRPAPRTP